MCAIISINICIYFNTYINVFNVCYYKYKYMYLQYKYMCVHMCVTVYIFFKNVLIELKF